MNIRAKHLLSRLQGCRRYRVTATADSTRPISSRSLMKRKDPEVVEFPQAKRPRRQMETHKICLTARESQLRNLLLDAARYIDESKEIKDKIELRWAGGWVRDKLLGLPSHDIDVAINAMTGHRFCEKMQEFLVDETVREKHDLRDKDMGSLHKILANPEKSKHLETANTRLYDFDLDFVNLRKETYSEDSRNPQMEFGTAEEDALRRDATINALFYNLQTDLVEDFTGGLEDLKARRIRTPLDPYTTFKDDPLRVLRLIRFASRLGFTIDVETELSMSDPSVLEALKLKISRERIGVELEKMLKGNNPASALHLINRLGLYSTIFTDPTAHSSYTVNYSGWPKVIKCLEILKTKGDPRSTYNSLVRSGYEKYLGWMLAALAPLSGIPNPEPEKLGAKLPLPFGTNVAREGIKADSKVCNVVTAAFRNAKAITSLKSSVSQQKLTKLGNKSSATSNTDPLVTERDKLGMLIRKWDSQGGHWRIQVLFAQLAETFEDADHIFDWEAEVIGSWQLLIDHLWEMDLMDVESIKPIVDGKRLQKDLNAGPGPWMKDALDICMAWQLRNPELTKLEPEKARSEAIEEVKRRIEGLKIPVKGKQELSEGNIAK